MRKLRVKKFPYIVDRKQKQLIVFNLKDFLIFRKKFIGAFINKGKKSYSMKVYSYILNNLKKSKKINPFFIFFKLVYNIVPTVNLMQKKQKRKVVSMPNFLYGNQKNVLLMKWLVKQLKNRSNIYGIKNEDLLNNLIDAYNLRGPIMRLKRDHYEKIKATKINLKKLGGSKENRRLKREAIFEWKDNLYFKKEIIKEKKKIKKWNKDEKNFSDEQVEEEYDSFQKAKNVYFLRRSLNTGVRKSNAKLDFSKKIILRKKNLKKRFFARKLVK